MPLQYFQTFMHLKGHILIHVSIPQNLHLPLPYSNTKNFSFWQSLQAMKNLWKYLKDPTRILWRSTSSKIFIRSSCIWYQCDTYTCWESNFYDKCIQHCLCLPVQGLTEYEFPINRSGQIKKYHTFSLL